MPELVTDSLSIGSSSDSPNKKKRDKSDDESHRIFNADDEKETQGYETLFDGSGAGAYLFRRLKEQKLKQQIEEEGGRLATEDPAKLEEMKNELKKLETSNTSAQKKKYHPKLVEEAMRASRHTLTKLDGGGQFFEMTDEERTKLEAMFSEMEDENYGKLNESSDKEDETERSSDEKHTSSGRNSATSGRQSVTSGRKSATSSRKSASSGRQSTDSGRQSATSRTSSCARVSIDDDDEEDITYQPEEDTTYQGEEVITSNNKKKDKELHFSRWERDPLNLPKQKEEKDIKEKFKPRLNVVWEKRLANSKLDKVKKTEQEFNKIIPPPSQTKSLFKKKPKSNIPSIVITENKNDKLEPTSVEIKNPRHNRSSELRLQQRLLRETMNKMGSEQPPLSRSVSQNGGLGRKKGSYMRRTKSLKNVSHGDKKRWS